MTNAPYSKLNGNGLEARTAALSGTTRQMICEDSFAALVALLVDCGAIPKAVMSEALDRLGDQMAAKARGQIETDFLIYPAELFDRARDLFEQAAALRA